MYRYGYIRTAVSVIFSEETVGNGLVLRQGPCGLTAEGPSAA